MCLWSRENLVVVMDMSDRGLRVLVETVTGFWRRILVVGAFNIVAGVAALIWPGATVLVLAIVLGIFLLLSGAALLAIGASVRSLLMIVLGVLSLVAAVICLAHPGAGVFAILLGCALWFFVNGVLELSAAILGVAGRLLWGVLGVLSIAAAVIMVSSPGVAVFTVALIAGISFLIHGTGEVALALRLRTAHRVRVSP
jgi:uncharacterized membrane protein HdeD (DUF308 family)